MSIGLQPVSPRREEGVAVRGSPLLFRGPVAAEGRTRFGGQTHMPNILFLGGSETFGGYVARPFAQRFARQSGLRAQNLGVFCAGWEALARDPVVLQHARSADLIVVQLMGPQYRSNPYFRVHPRRNDRFLAPCAPLRQLFPQVDFSQFSFVGHLLANLQHRDVYAHRRLQRGLQQAWRQHIRDLVRLYRRPVVFLWVDHGMDPGLGERVAGLTKRRLAELDLARVPLLRVPPDPFSDRPMLLHPEGEHGPITVISSAYHQRVADALTHWLPPLLQVDRIH